MKTGRALRLFDDTGLDAGVRRSLYVAILAITLGQVCFTITGGPALTGFIRQLGGGDFAVSLLSAVPVIGSLVQMPASFLVERFRSRRGCMLAFGVVQRAVWLGVALVPYVVPGQIAYARVWATLSFVALSGCAAAFVNVSFFSLMGDLVPMRLRGRYFATRSSIATCTGVAAGLLSGLLLDWLPGYAGYTVVFTLCAVFGVADICCFFFVPWPPMQVQEKREGFAEMLGQVLRNKPYMRLVLFAVMWYFPVRMSGPFFSVYMLGTLRMTYLQISILSTTCASVSTVLTIGAWGRLMDRYGVRPVIVFCMAVACGLPLSWNWTRPGSLWLIPITEAVSGAVWATIDMGFQNLYLFQSPQKNRTMYVAVYAVFTQLIGNAVAFVLGGALVERVMPRVESWGSLFGMTMTRYNGIFLLSMFARVLVLVLFLRLLQDEGSSSVAAMLRGVAQDTAQGVSRRVRAFRVLRARRRAVAAAKRGGTLP